MTGHVCVQTWDSSNQGQDVEAHCGPDVGKCDREMNSGLLQQMAGNTMRDHIAGMDY